MRSILSIAVLLVACSPAWAQLNPLPSDSKNDGIILRSSLSPVALKSEWSRSRLNEYRISSDYSFSPPAAGGVDRFGNRWTGSAPNHAILGSNGGTFRAIFLGNSGGWLQGIGYAYQGDPTSSDSFTLSASPNALHFGDYADVPLLPTQADVFDYWISTRHGTSVLLNPEHGGLRGTQVLWTELPLLISTFVPALNDVEPVATWVVDVSEPSGEPGVAPNEFRIAFQQITRTGQPVAGAPIPEPSTYGLVGAALLSIFAVRRRQSRR